MDNPQKSSLMSYIFTYNLVNKNNVTVSIDGQGADEIQGGYIFYLIHHFSNLNIRSVIPEVHRFVNLKHSYKYIIYGLILNLIRRIGLKKPWVYLLKVLKLPLNPFLSINERLKNDISGNLINLLHYGDRGAMASSIESRFPFLDYRLVEFWISLPNSSKISLGWTKFLARQTFSERLPEKITWRKHKLGWAMPEEYWFKTELKEMVIDVIYGSVFLKQFKLPNCKKILNSKKSNRKQVNEVIKFYNLALWHEIFFEENK